MVFHRERWAGAVQSVRRPNFFAAGGLDRVSHRRLDAEWLERRLGSERSRVTLVWRSKSLVLNGDPPRAGFLPLETQSAFANEASTANPLVLLGSRADETYFALDVSDHPDPLAALGAVEEAEFLDLRQVATILESEDASVLAYARAMMAWDRRHRHCGTCGAPTTSTQAGHMRLCSDPECGTEIFPRTDPAVIMLVADADSCLLGRQASWPPGVYSTLAGFVEPGESLEDAVRREVMEEAGIEIDECYYHSSQPWPFPSSLMLGFHATAARGEVRVDPGELEEANWFERQAILERQVRLPPRLSIARRLIDDWLAGGVAR